MPTAAQEDFLKSLFDSEGAHFEVISEDKSIDAGTKVLYLQRALSEDCQAFNKSLDKLYQADSSNLELIRSLKLINDMHFNNEVNFDEFGIKHALRHYLGGIGNNIKRNASSYVPYSIEEKQEINECQSSIKKLIQNGISILSNSNQDTLESQKNNRISAEADIIPQEAWRLELKLPKNQLTEQQREAKAAQEDVQTTPASFINFIAAYHRIMIAYARRQEAQQQERRRGFLRPIYRLFDTFLDHDEEKLLSIQERSLRERQLPITHPYHPDYERMSTCVLFSMLITLCLYQSGNTIVNRPSPRP